MATKTIKLIKAWRLHPAGAVFSTEAAVADLLVQNGRAVFVEEKKEEAKPASERKAGKKS